MMSMPRTPGSVIGTAGASLQGAPGWAQNSGVVKAGRDGELRTAAILNRMALEPDGPTVLHDLRIPIPGFTANIDHVVVAGDRITLIDSKAWAPGFYWTLGGVTRRGMRPVPHCDKKTLPTACRALEQYLGSRTVRTATFASSVLVVWTERPGAFLSWLYRPQDAIVIPGPSLARMVRRVTGHAPANPVLVQALANLVNRPASFREAG